MKKRKLSLLVAMLVLVLSLTGINVNASTYLTDKDGLEIEVSDITSAEVLSTQDYIKKNLNTTYATFNKFEATDVIYAKQLVADAALLPEEKTINAMYDAGADAFIVANNAGIKLYDVDENSNYLVGLVDTMHDNPNSTVVDTNFAYVNLNGESVYDCIYDYDTGLAYVPKKYHEENRNGEGVLNTQIELLHSMSPTYLDSTIDVEMDVDGVSGSFAPTGKATVEALATEFGVRVALDDEARQNIDSGYFKVYVNDTQITNFKYYRDSGILIVKEEPNIVSRLKIEISTANSQEPKTMAISADQMETLTNAGTWIVTDYNTLKSKEGQLLEPIVADCTMNFTYSGGTKSADMFPGWYNTDLWIKYDAWDHDDSVNGSSEPGYNLYIEADDNMHTLGDTISDVKNGGTSLNNLVRSENWLQHEVHIARDINLPEGITIPAPETWLLKCGHSDEPFNDDTIAHYKDANNDFDFSLELHMRLFKVTPSYIIVGVLSQSMHTQAGTGILKIAIVVPRGNVAIEKQLTHNGQSDLGEANCEGIEYTLYANEDIYEGSSKIYSKDQAIQTVTFDAAGSRQTIEQMPYGHYYWKETKANASTTLSDKHYEFELAQSSDGSTPTAVTVATDEVKSNDIEITKYLGKQIQL